jgi:hypothetical protein
MKKVTLKNLATVNLTYSEVKDMRTISVWDEDVNLMLNVIKIKNEKATALISMSKSRVVDLNTARTIVDIIENFDEYCEKIKLQIHSTLC